MHLIKDIINAIVKPLTEICYLSFSSGVFPNDMKIAKVDPLFESGDLKSFNNYRPVSLLSQFSKILEKLFCKSLVTLLKKKTIS